MRLRTLKLAYFLFLAVIAIRLFYWQVIRYDHLSALAEQQHVSSQTIDASRGVIMAADKSVLVSNQPAYLLYGLPKVIADKEDFAAKIAAVLITQQLAKPGAPVIEEEQQKLLIEEKKSEILGKVSQNLFWIALEKNVDTATRERIEALKLKGLGFDASTARFYPEASSSAHILGFVGSDPFGKQVGYFGIEGFYNGELRGTPGLLTEEKDAKGSPILTGKFFQKEPQKGHDLVLNIDRTVQYIAEKKVKEGMIKYGAKAAYVVIMEPKTGAMLAMASYPNYDPSHYVDFPKNDFKNPIVADSYEPGSTFKVLQAAAAINEGLITPDTICDICSGPVRISGFDIRTWDNKYHPNSTMTETIIHSDNTGMVFISRKLGLDKMYDYIEKFGFGNSTKIDLQDETSPDIRPKDQWREIDTATASFGQGIAATGIQMVRAIATIANGGHLMEPHIVKFIQDGERTIEIKPKIVGNPLQEKTTKTVTQMMIDAVDKGEAQFYKKKIGVGSFKIAGKTGTAQIPVAGHYDPTKTIASFVGFAPADDPKFVMLVRYTEPTTSIYGADTAAPTFFEIAKELFTYYGIAPTQ